MARFFSRSRSILKYLASLNKERSFTERLTASNEVVQREDNDEDKKRDLGLFTKDEDIKIEDSATVTTLLSNVAASGVTSKDAIVNLPSSGLTAGDASIVFIDSNTAKYYISNGEGWYNATFANVDPQWNSAPNSSYTLDSTNPLTIEPIAIDSGGKIFSYTATLNSDANQFLTVTKDSANGRIFTLVGDSEGGVPSSSNSGVVTFKASDGIGLVVQNSTINLSYGDSRWFIDEFTTNTTSSSEYAITNTSTAATWNNSGYIYFNTGDNHSSEIEWTPSDGQPLRSEGRVFAVFQKTADWPSDNASDIYLKHSNGTDYYTVRYAGSAYQSYITKTVSSSVTDTQNISYNFDDQSSYHTFELQWSSDTIKFYVDGTLQGTLTPSNNTTPIEISSVNFFFTQIQGPLTAIGYQDYGSDASAHPFIS